MIYISQQSWNKIINYAQAAYDWDKSEIGGMAVCVEDDDGDWTIQKPIILKQEISSGNCVLDKEELAKYYTKVDMDKSLKGQNYRFLWWHSHHTMAAFWSSTDLTAIQEFNEGDFSFALVVNLKQEYKLRVSVWQPTEIHKDVDLKILNPKQKTVPSKIMEDVKSLCNKEKDVAPLVSYNNNWRQTNIWGHVTKSSVERDVEWETLFNKTYEFIDKQSHETVMGEIEYDKFASNIAKFNKKLESKKSGIVIEIPPKNQSELIFTMQIEDYIQVDEDKSELAQQVLDEIFEMKSYNYGFKYGGGC